MKSEKCITKWYHKKILCIPIWAIGFAVLITAAGYAQQQTLQLATYYPAPYGEYTQMKIGEKLEMLPTSKLQATKGAGASRIGLEVDLTKSDPVQLSSFLDINNSNYSIDPNGTSIFKQLRTEEISGNVKFGSGSVNSWPVLAYPNGSLLPKPVKMYFGTIQTGGKASVTVGGFFGFGTSSDYFVMISPRNLVQTRANEGNHRHVVRITSGNRSTTHETVNIPVTSYSISSITKNSSSFTVNFSSTPPDTFDWIAIGN